MTFDEHMCMKGCLMDVRDELQDLCRRDPNVSLYIEKLNYCLAVLQRPHVKHALTQEPSPVKEGMEC